MEKKDWIHKKGSVIWHGMVERCENNPAYSKVKISEEFQDKSKFLPWFREQVENGWYHQGWHIDKDIISSGGRLYSRENCAFVPAAINGMFVHAFNRGYSYANARGVQRVLSSCGDGYDYNIFKAEIKYEGKQVFFGEYDYELFAFFDYKWAFEEFIQNKAEELKDKLHPKMYEALMNHRVLPR
jgi:hypothetical protein